MTCLFLLTVSTLLKSRWHWVTSIRRASSIETWSLRTSCSTTTVHKPETLLRKGKFERLVSRRPHVNCCSLFLWLVWYSICCLFEVWFLSRSCCGSVSMQGMWSWQTLVYAKSPSMTEQSPTPSVALLNTCMSSSHAKFRFCFENLWTLRLDTIFYFFSLSSGLQRSWWGVDITGQWTGGVLELLCMTC